MVLIMEVGLWGLLSVVALDNEAEFFHNYDLYKFEEFIEDNWYFEMVSRYLPSESVEGEVHNSFFKIRFLDYQLKKMKIMKWGVS